VREAGRSGNMEGRAGPRGRLFTGALVGKSRVGENKGGEWFPWKTGGGRNLAVQSSRARKGISEMRAI